ncbi:hypothetical protein ACIQU5_27730 [Streptomyces sp. NPDC090306]|uniref:hypothetical protein n=1 Tax=Streptomyces sp. NPDC090306 TaxID=3365961 RepID=UPI0037F5C131
MVKKSATLVGLVACVPLLLAGPVLLASGGMTVAACSPDTPVDAAAVAAQVKAILDGGDASAVTVAGLPDPTEQIPSAETIVATGIALGVSAHGQVIALAVALQESGLVNLPHGDLDSLGPETRPIATAISLQGYGRVPIVVTSIRRTSGDKDEAAGPNLRTVRIPAEQIQLRYLLRLLYKEQPRCRSA